MDGLPRIMVRGHPAGERPGGGWVSPPRAEPAWPDSRPYKSSLIFKTGRNPSAEMPTFAARPLVSSPQWSWALPSQGTLPAPPTAPHQPSHAHTMPRTRWSVGGRFLAQGVQCFGPCLSDGGPDRPASRGSVGGFKPAAAGLQVRRPAATPRGSGQPGRDSPCSGTQAHRRAHRWPWCPGARNPLSGQAGGSVEAPGRGRWTSLRREGNFQALTCLAPPDLPPHATCMHLFPVALLLCGGTMALGSSRRPRCVFSVREEATSLSFPHPWLCPRGSPSHAACEVHARVSSDPLCRRGNRGPGRAGGSLKAMPLEAAGVGTLPVLDPGASLPSAVGPEAQPPQPPLAGRRARSTGAPLPRTAEQRLGRVPFPPRTTGEAGGKQKQRSVGVGRMWSPARVD